MLVKEVCQRCYLRHAENKWQGAEWTKELEEYWENHRIVICPEGLSTSLPSISISPSSPSPSDSYFEFEFDPTNPSQSGIISLTRKDESQFHYWIEEDSIAEIDIDIPPPWCEYALEHLALGKQKEITSCEPNN